MWEYYVAINNQVIEYLMTKERIRLLVEIERLQNRMYSMISSL